MNPEQALITALKEAIAQVREHNADYQHETPKAVIDRWLAVQVTCRTCEGQQQLVDMSVPVYTAFLQCPACNGSGTRPLKDVI